jgi:tetratricopeptide (TPR) repeat protein
VPNIIKTDNPPSNKHLLKRKRLLIIVAVVVFVGGIASGWLYIQSQKTSEDQQKRITDELVVQTTTDAQIIARKGDTAGAIAKYDEVIKTTNDSYQKSILTINKAVIYLNTEDYEQALKYAKEAESINVNFEVVKIIAQIYEEMGNKQDAIAYYEKTIQLIDKEDPLASDDAVYYQSVIDGLKGDDK